MTTSIDNRTYFGIENSDRSLQKQLTTVVGVISTIINFLLFYLILKHSRRESSPSKCVNFLQSLLLYLAQLFWGSFFSIYFLLPFPAIYGIGVLSNVLSSFWLFAIWMFLFANFAVMMFVMILIRLKAIARSKGIFDLKPLTYTFIVLSIQLLAYIPVPYAWFSSYRTEEQMREHIKQFYPNCRKALGFTGIFLFVDNSQLIWAIVSAVSVLIIGGSTYVLFCLIIIFEIRQQGSSMSFRKLKHHVKVLIDITIQNIFRFVFLAIPPFLIFTNALVSPDYDNIKLFTIENAAFSAAPIPCAILMYVQNENYRQFFKRNIMFWKKDFRSNQVFEKSSFMVKLDRN